MLDLPLKLQRSIVPVFILSVGAGAGLLLWNDPLVLLLVGGGAGAAAIVVVLLRRPLLALKVALFLYLLPSGLRPDWSDLAVTVATNGAIAVAVCAWMLHAPFQCKPILWNTVYFFLALYIVWASITLLWTPDLIEGRKKLVAYCLGLIMLFLIGNQVRSLEAIDGLMRVLMMIGWILVIAGFWALLFTDYQFGNRLKVFDMNEGALGYYFTITLPGVIWPVLQSSGHRRRLYMALSVVFILCAMILVLASGGRGSSISMVTMLLAFWFWKPLRPWGVVGGVLVAGMLIAAPILLTSLNNRANDNWGTAIGDRDLLWIASVQLIEDHPLTGMGVGNGPFELLRYARPLTIDFDHRDSVPSHNPLLEVGIDTGLFGMLVYLSVCVSALWRFVRCRGPKYLHGEALAAYFPIVLVSAAGYFVSFVKDGGMESHPTYILLLALLIIPSQLLHGSALKTVSYLVNMPGHGLGLRYPSFEDQARVFARSPADEDQLTIGAGCPSSHDLIKGK